MSEKERFFGDETGAGDDEKDKPETEKPEGEPGEPTEPTPSLPEEKPTIERPTIKDLEDVASLDYLKAISQASGGFSYALDWQSGPNAPLGHTDMETKVISLNPWHLAEMLKKPNGKEAVEGLLTHEAGHHAPEVKKLDGKMVAHLGTKDAVPEDLVKTPEEKGELLQTINRHLCNALLDCDLEGFMGRRPHHRTREAIDSLYAHGDERPTLQYQRIIGPDGKEVDRKSISKPEQLCQLLVGEDRHPGKKPLKELVDPDVYKVYTRLKKSGAIDTMNSAKPWEYYFATDVQHDAAITRKFFAFREVFLPAWLELFEAEAEKRKEEEKKEGEKGKGGKPGEGEPGEGGEGELTPEQIKEILEQLMKELQKAGEKYKSQAPTPGEGKEINKIIQQILEKGEAAKPEPAKPSPQDEMSKMANAMRREWDEARRRGMAEGSGIRIESVRTWENIKKEKQVEIDTAAAQIADVFLDDRRKRIEYMRREGEIVPGMEYEHIAAIISGDESPQTHMKQVQNPEFLEMEIEHIQDVSGSMSGEPLRRCLEFQIVMCEALRKVKESLADEQLLYPMEEDPLRMGFTKFDTQATRVKKLNEPMNDQTEMKIIDELTKGGGGTNEKEALETVYGELTLGKKNVLKFMIIFSDGHGNKEVVETMMRQIEQDDEVIVAVVGLGEGGKAVIEAYTSGLRKGKESNIHAFEEPDGKTLMPHLLDFFREQVNKRRSYR